MSKMTLDILAVMVQKGFEETAKKVDLLALTERVDLLEERIGRLEQRVEYGFDMVAQELKEIKIQLKEIDARADVFGLQLRVDKIEKRMKAR